MHPRNLIIVGRNAKATVIESYVSTSDAMYFTNAVTEVSLGDGATLRHYKMQREGARAFHVGTIEVAAGARQPLRLVLVRDRRRAVAHERLHDARRRRRRRDAERSLHARRRAALRSPDADHPRAAEHASAASCTKAILDGRSHGVFNGKVYVHPIAQKTDGKQTNNTLLLSETAQIDTKPQLEIFADDVKCTHGATIGQIDQTALFYLKSRGIDNALARRLLTYAFAADVLETIEVDAIREGLERMTLERFV